MIEEIRIPLKDLTRVTIACSHAPCEAEVMVDLTQITDPIHRNSKCPLCGNAFDLFTLDALQNAYKALEPSGDRVFFRIKKQ